MQLVHSPSSVPHPFSSRANAHATRSLKVHFKLPVIKKASATVSVTNTNAARVDTNVSQPAGISFPAVSCPVPSASCVPFPSSPIPCPSRKRAISEDSYEPQDGESTGDAGEDDAMDVDEPQSKGSALPFHRRIAHIDILRRRSKSSVLSSSYFHSDSHSHSHSHSVRKTHHTSDQPVEGPPARKRPAVRRESMSAGTPTPRVMRKTKRVLADAQFLASMHSSIAMQVRTRISNGGAESGDECASQDAVLVERIWHALVDMGYKPVPLNDSPPPGIAPAPSSSPSPSDSTAPSSQPSPTAAVDPAREAAERAARRTMAVSSSTSFVPDRVQDLPLTPTGTLSVPQLVAVLTMRHRDRSTTRPRSASKIQRRAPGEDPGTPSRSPLSSSTVISPMPVPVPDPSAGCKVDSDSDYPMSES
ncbi:hypothetical protein C8Q74DRAFT_1312768 [Fomes fomentarius]|nr:hypothetical protein C8Q74DRAFT_1312768 [Fomes fomentarius]